MGYTLEKYLEPTNHLKRINSELKQFFKCDDDDRWYKPSTSEFIEVDYYEGLGWGIWKDIPINNN